MVIKQTNEYKKWFTKLRDIAAKAKIADRIQRLSKGNPGDVKAVGNGISELRISYGPGYRVYFKQTGGMIVFLLIGGDKSTQSKDIKKAKEIANNI